jgi:regulator of microtubule dynamics protein 3
MLAYGLNPEDAESNYIMAISVGNMAMVSGPRRRLEGINQAKIFIDQALQSDASHAGAWHLLGRWHFKMANLNLAEIAAARILFGGVGNEASNYKAIEALQQAIKYDAENIRYYFDLATIYKELNEKQACVSILEKALALDVATSEDLETARRCKMMLHKQVK